MSEPAVWAIVLSRHAKYVGLYLMAVSCNPAVKKQLSPALLKLLKGKSCFHVKQLTPELRRDISSALEVSYDGYRKLGWI